MPTATVHDGNALYVVDVNGEEVATRVCHAHLLDAIVAANRDFDGPAQVTLLNAEAGFACEWDITDV